MDLKTIKMVMCPSVCCIQVEHKNPSCISDRNRQVDPKIHMESHRTQSSHKKSLKRVNLEDSTRDFKAYFNVLLVKSV
jgi:hypothetical protein